MAYVPSVVRRIRPSEHNPGDALVPVILDHGDQARVATVALGHFPRLGDRFDIEGLTWEITRVKDLQRGYVAQEGALEQIPVGASQEQVLIVLGTPSTVATVSGEAFYYISQTSQRAFAFMPYEVKDQRVIAVYFDKDRRVERLANYGLKDGKVFDFVTQTTPTGGKDAQYLRNVFRSLAPRLSGG